MSAATFKCDFCQVSMTGHVQYTQHMGGKKHLKKVKAEGLVAGKHNEAGQFAAAAANVGNGQAMDVGDPVQRAVMQNMLGKVPAKRKFFDEKCDICDVLYNSESHKAMHINGSKHAKKQKLLEPKTIENEAMMYCSFCNIKVNGVDQMDQHRLGERHKKKLAVARELQQMSSLEASKKMFPATLDTPEGTSST